MKAHHKKLVWILGECSHRLQEEFEKMDQDQYEDGVCDALVVGLQATIDDTLEELDQT